jgi:hypothetical protein
MGHRYTPEEIQFLKDNASGRTFNELAEMFNRRFNLTMTGSKLGVAFRYYDPARRFKRHKYTPEEIQFIKDNVPGRSYFELQEMFNRRFNFSLSKDTIETYLSSNKFKNNRNNKLSDMKYFKYNQFPIGSEIKSNGCIYVKIACNPSVWKKKKIVIWEEANGPIPKNHVILCVDENKLNTNLDNLLLVSRRELSIMNVRHLIFPDVGKTKCGLLIAKIIILANDHTGKTRKHGKKRGEQ